MHVGINATVFSANSVQFAKVKICSKVHLPKFFLPTLQQGSFAKVFYRQSFLPYGNHCNNKGLLSMKQQKTSDWFSSYLHNPGLVRRFKFSQTAYGYTCRLMTNQPTFNATG